MITKGPKHWPHQLQALRFIHSHNGSLLWVPMRAGKTRIAIDYIQNTPGGNSLIVSPVKVIPEWVKQLGFYLAEPDKWVIVPLGENVPVVKRAELVKHYSAEYKDNCIFLLNYDVLNTKPLSDELLKHQWHTIVFDEIHRLKAPGGSISRFASKLSRCATKRVGLSGTPGNPLGSPKKKEMREAGILDLYGVMRTLAPGLFAFNYNQYKAKFGLWNQFTPFPKIEGYQNQDIFDAKLAQVCFHVNEKDLTYSLPPVIKQILTVTLPANVRAVYDELEANMVAEWTCEEEEVSASNALVKQLRLQQLATGFLQLDAIEDIQLDISEKFDIKLVHSEKFDIIKERVEDIPEEERILVFCQFDAEMNEMRNVLQKTGRKVFAIRGGENTLDNWKKTPGAVLIVQFQAGGEGLDLSEANYVFMSSLCHSMINYQQAFMRPQKANKQTPIVYYYVQAENTIDIDMYAAQEAKEDVVSSVKERLIARRA